MDAYLVQLYVTWDQEAKLKQFFVQQGWVFCKLDLSATTDKLGPLKPALASGNIEKQLLANTPMEANVQPSSPRKSFRVSLKRTSVINPTSAPVLKHAKLVPVQTGSAPSTPSARIKKTTQAVSQASDEPQKNSHAKSVEVPTVKVEVSSDGDTDDDYVDEDKQDSEPDKAEDTRRNTGDKRGTSQSPAKAANKVAAAKPGKPKLQTQSTGTDRRLRKNPRLTHKLAQALKSKQKTGSKSSVLKVVRRTTVQPVRTLSSRSTHATRSSSKKPMPTRTRSEATPTLLRSARLANIGKSPEKAKRRSTQAEPSSSLSSTSTKLKKVSQVSPSSQPAKRTREKQKQQIEVITLPSPGQEEKIKRRLREQADTQETTPSSLSKSHTYPTKGKEASMQSPSPTAGQARSSKVKETPAEASSNSPVTRQTRHTTKQKEKHVEPSSQTTSSPLVKHASATKEKGKNVQTPSSQITSLSSPLLKQATTSNNNHKQNKEKENTQTKVTGTLPGTNSTKREKPTEKLEKPIETQSESLASVTSPPPAGPTQEKEHAIPTDPSFVWWTKEKTRSQTEIVTLPTPIQARLIKEKATHLYTGHNLPSSSVSQSEAKPTSEDKRPLTRVTRISTPEGQPINWRLKQPRPHSTGSFTPTRQIKLLKMKAKQQDSNISNISPKEKRTVKLINLKGKQPQTEVARQAKFIKLKAVFPISGDSSTTLPATKSQLNEGKEKHAQIDTRHLLATQSCTKSPTVVSPAPQVDLTQEDEVKSSAEFDRQSLTYKEEKRLVDMKIQYAKDGQGLSGHAFLVLATEYAVALGKKKLDSPMYGVEWFTSLKRRWPAACYKDPYANEVFQVRKARATTNEALDRHHAALQTVISLNGLQFHPDRIWNIDEYNMTNLMHDCPSKFPFASYDPELRSATVIGCGNAAGRQLPPYILFSDKSKPSSSDSVVGKSFSYTSTETGTLNPVNFLSYLNNHFLKHVARNKGEKHLVIVDDYRSHVAVSLTDWGRENNVEMYVLPPHTASLLQPLVVSCFAPLRSIYRIELETFLHTYPVSDVTKTTVAELISIAYSKAFAHNSLVSGFRLTRIIKGADEDK